MNGEKKSELPIPYNQTDLKTEQLLPVWRNIVKTMRGRGQYQQREVPPRGTEIKSKHLDGFRVKKLILSDLFIAFRLQPFPVALEKDVPSPMNPWVRFCPNLSAISFSVFASVSRKWAEMAAHDNSVSPVT